MLQITVEKKLSVIVGMNKAQFIEFVCSNNIDDLRAFLIIPVTENNPSTGTDDALGVRYTRANMAKRKKIVPF